METKPKIRIENLTMAYGSRVIQKDLDFDIPEGEVLAIIGGSGCGKSTLLKHCLGLIEPAHGSIYYGDVSFTDASVRERRQILRRCGVLYQSGALWSSMTVGENVALPLKEFTPQPKAKIAEIVRFKLSLVGLEKFVDFYPSEISGGMKSGLAWRGHLRWIRKSSSLMSHRPVSTR